MSNPINFDAIKGGKSKNGKEMQGAFGELEETLPEIIAFMKIRAKVLKEYKDNLISEGFTESEAMEIVKNDKTMG